LYQYLAALQLFLNGRAAIIQQEDFLLTFSAHLNLSASRDLTAFTKQFTTDFADFN
jgi:hypothetical protein